MATTPFSLLLAIAGNFNRDELTVLFKDGFLPWRAVGVCKQVHQLVLEGKVTVHNLLVQLSDADDFGFGRRRLFRDGFERMCSVRDGFERWAAVDLPIKCVHIRLWVLDHSFFVNRQYIDGLDTTKVDAMTTLCKMLMLRYCAGGCPKLIFSMRTKPDMYESVVHCLSDLRGVTSLTLAAPLQDDMTIETFKVLETMTALTELSYEGSICAEPPSLGLPNTYLDRPLHVMFKHIPPTVVTFTLNAKFDTWRHKHLERCVKAFADSVSAGGLAALRVLDITINDDLMEARNLDRLVDAVARLPALTNFRFEDRSANPAGREAQKPSIDRLIAARPELRVLFSMSG